MILWEEHNGICIITMDAPGKNALSVEDLHMFIETIELHKESMQGLIITGNNHSFCSGLSLKDNQFAEAFPLLDKLLLTLYELEVPIICAMHGHAIGAGFLIMCCADRVYATESARSKFGLPEIKLDLGIDDLMLNVLRERLDQKQLKNLLLSGEYVSLSTLQHWGIVDLVFETDENMIQGAIGFVEEMIVHYPSYCFTKRLLHREKYVKMRELMACECWDRLVEFIKDNVSQR